MGRLPGMDPETPRKRRRGGSTKETARGGRKKGSRNKTTIERERAAAVATEREKLLKEVRAGEAKDEVIQAVAAGKKMMKEIAFDFAQLFAGIAAFHQPYPSWHPATIDGKAVMVNDNPNFNEAKFKEYAKLAVDTALGAAGYESPKLSAVMVGSAIVTEIEITGGLPDSEDGGLNASTDAPGDAPGLPDATDADQGERGHPDAPPDAGGAVPAQGQAQGGPVRKAVG